MKELEALKRLKDEALCCEGDLIADVYEDYTAIEKIIKAFYIIKEKLVSLDLFKDSATLSNYNYYVSEKNELTQDEFTFLKEVL